MKNICSLALLCSALCLTFPAAASGDFAAGCSQKESAILSKMEYARKYGNQAQLAGLEKALREVRTWCSDGSLLAKAELRVMEKEDKVADRQNDLEEALREGKSSSKIAKLQRKLDEAKDELENAAAERDALKKLK